MASKDDGRSGEIHDSGSDATEDDSGSSKAQDESSGDEAAEGRRQDNEITAEDLESVKGKSHAKPQVHVKLEASKKEKPGDLVEELQKEGAKIKKKDKAKVTRRDRLRESLKQTRRNKSARCKSGKT